jgi:hypothetical protein
MAEHYSNEHQGLLITLYEYVHIIYYMNETLVCLYVHCDTVYVPYNTIVFFAKLSQWSLGMVAVVVVAAITTAAITIKIVMHDSDDNWQ